MSNFYSLPKISDMRFKDVWVNGKSNPDNCGICEIELGSEGILNEYAVLPTFKHGTIFFYQCGYFI